MMDWYGGMGPAGWVLMTVFWVVLLGVIAWAVVRLFPGRADGAPPPRETPDDELDRRLVRGEIDEDTYEALRLRLHSAQAERRAAGRR